MMHATNSSFIVNVDGESSSMYTKAERPRPFSLKRGSGKNRKANPPGPRHWQDSDGRFQPNKQVREKSEKASLGCKIALRLTSLLSGKRKEKRGGNGPQGVVTREEGEGKGRKYKATRLPKSTPTPFLSPQQEPPLPPLKDVSPASLSFRAIPSPKPHPILIAYRKTRESKPGSPILSAQDCLIIPVPPSHISPNFFHRKEGTPSPSSPFLS